MKSRQYKYISKGAAPGATGIEFIWYTYICDIVQMLQCLSEMEKGDIEHNILTKATKYNRLTNATINVSKLFI